MIDLDKIADRCHINAMRLGYKTDIKSVTKHLQGELKELKRSKWNLCDPINHVIADSVNKDHFKKMYEAHIKDSTPCELADMIIVSLTGLKALGVSPETILMNKIRYNEEHR